MESSFDLWMFLAGLGVFLFGMYHLEEGLKGLAGKSFKNFIQKFTNRTWKGILVGTLVTAVLQSSSLVTLVVLAFLGGGMLSLRNSLGVVLGANLGTTFTAWMVAALGFKVNVADFSYPFLALGMLSYLFLGSRPFLKNLGGFLVGFGLLFLGLDFMKDAIEAFANHVDLAGYRHYGLWIFLLIGLVVTALIQSSSAMLVIVLSALNSGVVDIYQAMAIAIGAIIGTTTTLIFGALGGTADKKRLSMANVIFKTVAGGITFSFIRPVVDFMYTYFHINDPVMELVLLNTLINVFGIILFYPFLGLFERFLKRRFERAEPEGDTLYIRKVTPKVPDIALGAIEKELGQVYGFTHVFILDCIGIGRHSQKEGTVWRVVFAKQMSLADSYQQIKRLEDELTDYYSQLQEQNLTPTESARLTNYMMVLRSLIYSAKDMKDVMKNIADIMDSDDELANNVLRKLQHYVSEKLHKLGSVVADGAKQEEMMLWKFENDTFYKETIAYLYQNIKGKPSKVIPVSTLTNVIKQTVSSLDNLCEAVVKWRSQP